MQQSVRAVQPLTTVVFSVATDDGGAGDSKHHPPPRLALFHFPILTDTGEVLVRRVGGW